MKRGTSGHPKVADLSRRLGVPLPHALGTLQYLWDFAEDYAPRGDVGRFPDETIAENCRWTGEPGALITALVDAKWLDRPKKSFGVRLGVHDWWEHCEDTVHRKIARAHEFFWNGNPPKLARLGKDERTAAEQWYMEHAHNVRTSKRAQNVRTACARNAPQPLPLPEPIPEPEPSPGAHAPTVATPKFGAWQTDESYQPLVEIYRSSGKPVIDEDFADAWWSWKKLDFEQKLARVNRLKANISEGLYDDPNFIPAPRKFIEREWKRELSARKTNGAVAPPEHHYRSDFVPIGMGPCPPDKMPPDKPTTMEDLRAAVRAGKVTG